MSDAFLRLIPIDPEFAPDPDRVQNALDVLGRLLPDADSITATTTEDVRFIDQGANFESIRCPQCGDDLEPWWQDQMDFAVESKFTDLEVTLPCCAALSSLNDLDYRWPAGFARFVMEAQNPNVYPLDTATLHGIEEAVGSPLRIVWAHY